ncbi:Rha family transcriptional regulator [Escherichia coli]|uniref:Rha family transcriptional regulator n=1 Tax=Escherichia coli TaxID=562 RepID=UPI00182216B5|nr:Rha family transcriptional regulator [Escherichia coli]MCU9609810.1 Rha family transcriptional regulator [Escherichia coli]MCV6895138.1 Rha family transcriptional regulator [Escherichia coli]HDL0430664.1 Rha family transcriptional regulator [Escherichia coli]
MNTVTTMNTAVKTASVSLVVDNTKPLTMSSRQIAEFVDKRHDNVVRDIRKMLNELEKDVLKFEGIYLDQYGREKIEYHLDEELTLTLVTGYDVKRRMVVIQEWKRLKEENEKLRSQQVNPYANMTKLDWIREAMELEAANEQLIQEKKQLVELHVRKAIDTHSLSRLLGEKRGSTKVQIILKGLCAAGVLERRLDASGKPKGYDLLPPGYMFARMSAHGQIEFTADAIPHLVKLGLLEEEKAATLKLPQPNNSRAIVNNTALLIRQNAGSLEHFGL